MKIIKYPNQILFNKSETVKIDNDLKSFVCEMESFMKTQLEWGTVVGLSAPQVGRNIKVFFALGKLYINPELLAKSINEIDLREGCYSLEENKFDYPVKRADWIMLKWQNLKGKWKQERFKGFPAQVIQHELDHLEGRCCIDYEQWKK